MIFYKKNLFYFILVFNSKNSIDISIRSNNNLKLEPKYKGIDTCIDRKETGRIFIITLLEQ